MDDIQARNGREMTVKEICDDLRKEIKMQEIRARNILRSSCFQNEQSYADQHSEIKANAMLAVRHLEDARMRIGKVLQANDGGLSVYDK